MEPLKKGIETGTEFFGWSFRESSTWGLEAVAIWRLIKEIVVGNT